MYNFVNDARAFLVNSTFILMAICYKNDDFTPKIHHFSLKSPKMLKILLNKGKFPPQSLAYTMKTHYLCNVFFMVLDLRLTKIGCRETINFFCYLYHLIQYPITHQVTPYRNIHII